MLLVFSFSYNISEYMTKLPELSIFFPFWNEEENIERVVKKAEEVASSIAKVWEIIIVDDGSTDKTLTIANKLARNNKSVRVITHHPNRGYGAALKAGLTHAQYKYVVFTDGDGQFDFNEVEKFIESIYDCDLVIGYRRKRNDQSIGKRLLLMRMLKIWDYLFFKFYFRDIDCGFKMFKKTAIEDLLPIRSEGAMVTTEILAKATQKKMKIKEVGVGHYPREFGEQTGANFGVIVRAILETFMIWLDIRLKRI